MKKGELLWARLFCRRGRQSALSLFFAGGFGVGDFGGWWRWRWHGIFAGDRCIDEVAQVICLGGITFLFGEKRQGVVGFGIDVGSGEFGSFLSLAGHGQWVRENLTRRNYFC